MPRGKRKYTQSGAPAQKIESVEGQRYGEGVAQQQLQQTLPAPDYGNAPAPPAPAAAMPPAGPAQLDPAALQAMLAGAPIGMLAGTQAPGEPVTAGLSRGPGGGPELLGTFNAQTPMSRMLRELSRRTGDDEWRKLAERAGL